MAKRFTDSLKWADDWFCTLSNDNKLFWLYLCDNCDHAGIWKVNIRLLRFHLGENFNPDPVGFGDRITILSKEKWYINKFVDFQYGKLNPENKAHKSVMAILKKEGATKGLMRGLKGANEGLKRGYQGPKDKDTDKETELDRDKVLETDKACVSG